MNTAKTVLLACTVLTAAPALAAEEADDAMRDRPEIVVTGALDQGTGATKTDVPLIEVPQPVTVIDNELFEAQGAISVSDTLRYVAGVQANPYGPDSRVDGGFVRGLNALQFRDGMRDIFSFYASIRADPYNFEQVELIRGPASVLFGAGSLGGIINLVSKTPEFTTAGEVAVRYGSFDRKEALADLTGPISDTLAARIVARVRDSGTQTDFVPDDRVLVSPSLTWAPTADTKLTLLGLYQEDDGGSTSQFLPLVGTILPNPNGRLRSDLFVGKPGWDRYDGRLLQGTALFQHRFSDSVRVNLKARYIDSDLTYLTHYPNSYSNPANPYVLLDPVTRQPIVDPDSPPDAPTFLPDPEQRTIGLYSDGSIARMEVFSTDNNVQFDFATGSVIEHKLLAGIDYSWNHVRKTGGFGVEYIDIYDIDYDALSNYGGGLPAPSAPSEDVEQKQLGFYLQDQIRFWDRVSVVLGVRHDKVTSRSFGVEKIDASATSFRAGIIGELVPGVSPFFSYTESFEPIAGTDVYGEVFVPKSGRQFELGVKLHPTPATLVTLTAYHIKEKNRPMSVVVPDPSDPSTPPRQLRGQLQTGALTSKGLEFEANARLPGNVHLIANYSYNEAEVDGTNRQIDNVPKHNASLWVTKGLGLGNEVSLQLGGGVRYSGANRSYSLVFPDGVLTPDHTLVDAFAEVSWRKWKFALNATNLLGNEYYSACLARGDCFLGAERNVYGTLSYSF